MSLSLLQEFPEKAKYHEWVKKAPGEKGFIPHPLSPNEPPPETNVLLPDDLIGGILCLRIRSGRVIDRGRSSGN